MFARFRNRTVDEARFGAGEHGHRSPTDVAALSRDSLSEIIKSARKSQLEVDLGDCARKLSERFDRKVRSNDFSPSYSNDADTA